MKKDDFGESDRIFTVYTKNFGKLEILARAVRKIKSKLRAGLEPFCLSEIEFIQGRGHKTATDAALINKFKNLRKSPKRLKIAHRIAEVFDGLVLGAEKEGALWNLLEETFERLNNAEIKGLKLAIVYYYFLWKAFFVLGYQPELYNCSVCQKKIIPEKIFFSPGGGGLICKNCVKTVKSVKEMSPEAVKVLRVILEKNWPFVSRLKIASSHLAALQAVSGQYYSFILSNL